MSSPAPWARAEPPSIAYIERLADEALGIVPERLRNLVDGVAIRIEDFPDDETIRDMDLESPFDILGLYRGVDLAHKSLGDVAHDVDMILLYRRPILDYWCEGTDALDAVIRHVLIHEIGHHFGLSDADMEAIEAEADIAASGTV
ncbi:MAG: metallopeptidase family protein [Alphaproteobacteria bacterium]|nr:metallopeptidase family protein [Alphaproteobacteria bacterium]